MKAKTIYWIIGIAAVAGVGVIGYRRGWFGKTSVSTKELKLSAEGTGTTARTAIPKAPCPNKDEQGRICNGEWHRNPKTGKCYCAGERVYPF